ncbi:MAG TPA: TSUP family transporter [Burkholderiaceae bacterium]|nr:TSUP family transporter [Burkholderiaceae bacterium]
MATHALFLLFVALAVYAQNLTGFALALILLGLIGVTDLVPLTDAVNAVTVMIVVNAFTFLYRRWPLQLERSLWPAVVASLLGAVAGIVLLTWLAGAAYQVLRFVLGIFIVACALLLWRAAKPLASASPARSFVWVGGLSGVLGGMFSAAGPPLVYLMYRQPWTTARIQEALILFFGIGALLRLAIVVPTGHFSPHAMQLAVEAVPVVFLVTAFAAGRPTPLSPRLLKAAVCMLLVATGAGMMVAALAALKA